MQLLRRVKRSRDQTPIHAMKTFELIPQTTSQRQCNGPPAGYQFRSEIMCIIFNNIFDVKCLPSRVYFDSFVLSHFNHPQCRKARPCLGSNWRYWHTRLTSTVIYWSSRSGCRSRSSLTTWVSRRKLMSFPKMPGTPTARLRPSRAPAMATANSHCRAMTCVASWAKANASDQSDTNFCQGKTTYTS